MLSQRLLHGESQRIGERSPPPPPHLARIGMRLLSAKLGRELYCRMQNSAHILHSTPTDVYNSIGTREWFITVLVPENGKGRTVVLH